MRGITWSISVKSRCIFLVVLVGECKYSRRGIYEHSVLIGIKTLKKTKSGVNEEEKPREGV